MQYDRASKDTKERCQCITVEDVVQTTYLCPKCSYSMDPNPVCRCFEACVVSLSPRRPSSLNCREHVECNRQYVTVSPNNIYI